jgi:hypothetical protein
MKHISESLAGRIDCWLFCHFNMQKFLSVFELRHFFKVPIQNLFWENIMGHSIGIRRILTPTWHAMSGI